MIFNKVVARFKDGTLMRGKINDFSPDKTHFHLELLSGEVVDVNLEDLKVIKINVEDLKAAFFVKDLEGNKNRKDIYDDAITGAGKKVLVKFLDGESIIGYSLSYATNRHGFFVVPADRESNNERIFVITSAIEKITFL